MSAFEPENVQATTLPGAFLELAQFVSAQEQQVVSEDPPDNISVSFDLDALTATVTATLPITYTSNAEGNIVITATDYLD